MMVKWLVGLLALFAIARCEREEQFKFKFDCSKYENGNYVFGCNPHYWVCTNNKAHELRCYGDLVLDPDENRCNYREKVRLCTDPKLPRIQPYRALELFSCDGKPDGHYSTGYCDNFFHSCENGIKVDNPCPSGEYFSNSTKKCTGKDEVDECKPENKKERPLAQPAVPTKTGTVKTDKPEKPSGPRPLPKLVSGEIKTLPSGTKMAISASMPIITGLSQNQTAIPSTTPPMAVLDCRELPDGEYELDEGACATKFWKCFSKRAQLFECPEGLFFNPKNKECDFIENVAACKESNTRTGTDSGLDVFDPPRNRRDINPPSPVEHGQFGYYNQQSRSQQRVQANPPAPAPLSVDCSNKADGFYEIGQCQRNYVRCQDQQSVSYTCPMNMVFLNSVCDHAEKCTSPSAPAPAPVMTIQDLAKQGTSRLGNDNYYGQLPSYGQPQPPQGQPTTKPVDNWCRQNNKPDGFHGVGCAPYFYSCALGFSTKMECPGGTFYDPETHECGNKDFIVSCGGKKPPTTTPSAMDATRPTTPPDMWCKNYNKPDGLHGAGCNAYFYACNGGFSTRMTCPGGLFFDPEAHQCANKEFIPICGGQRPTTLPPHMQPTQYTTPPDTWCQRNNKPDGYHGLGCGNYYYHCNGGFSQRLDCPGGLFYDPETHECNDKSFIPACGGYRPQPTTPPAMDSRPTTPPDVWCQHYNMPDGNHGLKGCYNYYYSCNGGFSIKVNCPGGLFYDHEIEQCTTRETVPSCGGKRPLPTTTTPASMNPTTPPDTFCRDHKLSDGLHGFGCYNYFYACNGGFSTRMTCPGNLYFDVDNGQCTNREWIRACGGTKPPVTTTLAPQMNPTTPPDMFCRNNKLPDGLHGFGCYNYFYACNGGFSTRMTCPGNTFFDPEEKQCNSRSQIVACGGRKPTTLPPHMQTTAYTTPPDNWCRQNGKLDGMHSLGCSNYFYACNGGFSTRLTCPGNLYFDEEEQHCTNQEWIKACGGQKPTTLPPQLNPTMPTTPPDTYCRDYQLPDGLHATGCQSYFYSCNGGFSTKLLCPTGLFYDPEEGHCTNRENIVVCGGVKTTTLAPQMQPTQYTSPPDMWCQMNRKPDGFHGLGCASYFYNCNGGHSLKIACPAGLSYDPETHECADRTTIPACGGRRPETTTPPAMDSRPTTPPDMWCQHYNMPDGIHGLKGCYNYYYSCNGGFSIKLNCPAGLFYDHEIEQCAHSEWVPACGGRRPLPTTTTPASMNPTTPPDTYCRDYKLPDGLHGVGCNSFFYSCNGGFSQRINCPAGLYFDNQAEECAKRDWIAACGGKRPITTTTTQPQFNPTTANPWCRSNGKPDGFHGDGCKPYFYHCQAGLTNQLQCPGNLVYDNDIHQCNNRNLVVACGGKKPVSTTKAPQNPYYQPAQKPVPQPAPQPQQAPPQPPRSNYPTLPQSGPRSAVALNVPPESLPLSPDNTRNPCSKLPNGIYGRRCSRHFFVCTNHSTFDFICPNSQAYDARVNRCAEKTQISTCSASTAPRTQY